MMLASARAEVILQIGLGKQASACSSRVLELFTATDAKNTSRLTADVIIFFMTAGTARPQAQDMDQLPFRCS